MLFNSLEFLIFFPIVCFLYFLIPHKYRWVYLLVSSYYFYMNWNAKYGILLFFVTLINYIGSIIIDYLKNKKNRLIALWSTILLSLFPLIYYKYFNFIGNNINYIFDKLHISFDIPFLDIILPVGISFFTFQALSYTIDVYNKNIKVEKNLGIFALFVSFFPQLVAGPIERATNLLPQFYDKHDLDADKITEGLRLMLWGMFKKVVVADRVALYVNAVFNNYEHHSAISYVVATLFFGIQLYCDFGGYSDIARGCARIMGFNLMVNFKFPYFSENFTVFWRKNHISLTKWLTEYIYMPIVDNGKPTVKMMCFATFITFLVSGIWHGSDWTFIIWGLFHAFFLIYDILIRKKRNSWNKLFKKYRIYKLSIYFRYFLTVILLSIGNIFFRANNTSQALEIIKGIFNWKAGSLYIDPRTVFYSFVGIFILILFEYDSNYDFDQIITEKFSKFRYVIYYFLIILIILIGVLDNTDFIYFQF